MPSFKVAFTGVAALTAAPVASIKGRTTGVTFIDKVTIHNPAATKAEYGLIRPNNTPVQSSEITPDATKPSTGTIGSRAAASWSTPPTINTATHPYDAKGVMPATIGAPPMVFDFTGDPLQLPASGFLVLWNFGGATGPAVEVTFEGRE